MDSNSLYYGRHWCAVIVCIEVHEMVSVYSDEAVVTIGIRAVGPYACHLFCRKVQ